MESQHEQIPRVEREQYEAPAGEELGTVTELTAGGAICYPSNTYCPD